MSERRNVGKTEFFKKNGNLVVALRSKSDDRNHERNVGKTDPQKSSKGRVIKNFNKKTRFILIDLYNTRNHTYYIIYSQIRWLQIGRCEGVVSR